MRLPVRGKWLLNPCYPPVCLCYPNCLLIAVDCLHALCAQDDWYVQQAGYLRLEKFVEFSAKQTANLNDPNITTFKPIFNESFKAKEERPWRGQGSLPDQINRAIEPRLRAAVAHLFPMVVITVGEGKLLERCENISDQVSTAEA